MTGAEEHIAQQLPADELQHYLDLEQEEFLKRFFKDDQGQIHETCTVDSGCEAHSHICGAKIPGVCGHKGVFPSTVLEMLGVFTFALVMALCTVAGIGGGGIAISLIIAFFNFQTKQAVAISSLSILVCTVMRFFYNFNTMHPQKNGVVLIDYSLVTIMMPTTIAGSQVGAVILRTFPALLIQTFLTILLLGLSYQSYRKAQQLHKKEKHELQQLQHLQWQQAQKSTYTPVCNIDNEVKTSQIQLQQQNYISPPTSRSNSVYSRELSVSRHSSQDVSVSSQSQDSLSGKPSLTLPIRTIEIGGKQFELGQSSAVDQELKALEKIVMLEGKHAQPQRQGLCLAMLLCVIMMNLLMPSQHSASIINIESCSPSQFTLQGIFLVICFSVTFVAIRTNQFEQNLKIKYGVNFINGDIRYQGNALFQLTGLGFVGGLVAGALGLGGGSIYNPAFLTLGVHPKVSGATGMFLVLFSTVNTCLVNYLNGFLHVNYAIWISFWSVLGAFLGMQLSDKVVAMTGKPSILVWILVFVFVLSTIATPVFGGMDLYYLHSRGENITAFSSYC